MTMEDEEESGGPNLLSAIPSMIMQRKWLLIVPTILALIAGVTAAMLMHPMFRSTATVIIESQQLPDSMDNGADLIDQRIARARQRVLTRADLIRLIRAYGLYPAQQRQMPLSKIVDMMRGATGIAVLNADLKPGARESSTIALTISFDYDDPIKAQIVAQQYVNRFLEVDASSQVDQAVGAASFLTDEASDLQSQIASIENEMNRIKSENGTILTLGTQSTGDPIADASRIDLDIARLENEIRMAQAQPSGGNDGGVAQAQAALNIAMAKYSPSHPDVIAAKAQLDAARQAASTTGSSSTTNAQIAAARAQIGSLRQAKGMLLSQSASAQAARQRAPAIQGRLDQLEKQADGLRDQYRTIGTKVQNANISAKVETEQKGERLTLADPPVVPDQPYKPNRPMIVAGALAAGIGFGMGMILLIELIRRPIRGTAAVTVATGTAPLVAIPNLSAKRGAFVRYLRWRATRKQQRARA
jgi:uncharacterized protein involved in exopolysaccharide biosynthesis